MLKQLIWVTLHLKTKEERSQVMVSIQNITVKPEYNGPLLGFSYYGTTHL